jgi:NAD(P)-dependent dehydrogenase (short-subunit alcohol dehydrogenase family)
MAFDITGRTALVTGANRGIGRQFSSAFIENGAKKVYAAVRSVDSSNDLIEEFGGRVEAIEFDLTRPETIEKAASKASDVELVVNNGGVLTKTSLFDDDVYKSLEFEMDVNFYGLIRTARAFAPVLKANGGGAFVQLNSVVSVKAFPSSATYSASKAASYSLTQSIRHELAEQGTEVYSVHPGPIDTDMAQTAGISEIAEPVECVSEALLSAFKAGRFHVWPDSRAKHIGRPYERYAKEIIESELASAAN